MMTAAAVAARPVAPFPALDHCYYDPIGFTVVKRLTADDPYVRGRRAFPGVFVLETLVQAARRCIGVPDLVLASVETADLRELPLGSVLTLRPDIAMTGDGWVVTAGSITLRCRRPGPEVPTRVAAPPASAGVDPAALLPYGPGLLLDTVSSQGGTAAYTVKAGEPCYRDRGPGPYPATLVLESFTQACQALLRLDGTRSTPRRARGVRVVGAVLPGQTLVHEVRPRGATALSGVTSAAGRAVLTVDRIDLGEGETTG